jgi:hypothetical protein
MLIPFVFPRSILVRILFGVIAALLARPRGRNPLGWFVLGFVAGPFAPLVLFALPNPRVWRDREEQERRERRRLWELLTMERLKNQAGRGYALRRIDAHDEVLGVDTRSVSGGPVLVPFTPEPAAAPVLDAGPPPERWYVASSEGTASGPLDVQSIEDRIRSGELDESTLVWHETLADWKPLESTPLRRLL